MSKRIRILAVNPGSTSTKIAVFENEKEVFKANVTHDVAELQVFKEVSDQIPFRKKAIEDTLAAHGLALKDMDIFVGRGGGLRPMPGGTYEVNQLMVEHARSDESGHHPAELGSQISYAYAREYGRKAYIVNAPNADEFDDIARVSGFADIFRMSSTHMLNQKEIALRYSSRIGKRYQDINLVICHIGGGISVSAHRRGRLVDSNDILGGDGPMTPTRAGTLPAHALLQLAFSGRYTQRELYDRLVKTGGLTSHLGTADVIEVERRIQAGDEYASLVFNAMIYQIAKDVGACAAALKGELEAIILTGGIARSEVLVSTLREYIAWIAPVEVMPGEFEMEALAAGALRVATGQEEALEYTGISAWKGFKK